MADSQRKSYNLFDVDWWVSVAVRRQCTATVANNVITLTATSSDPQLGYATSSAASPIPDNDKAAAIEIKENTTYTLTLSSSPKCYVTYYDSSWNCLNSAYNKIPVTLNPTSYTFTTPTNCKYITLRLGTDTVQSGDTYIFSNIMLVEGGTARPYEPYGWVHSLRKLCSATETIQSGNTIYANGQPITTYTLKGNTVQNGTPTPTNPIAVNGVGVRTENLCDESNIQNGYYGASTNYSVFTSNSNYRAFSMALSQGTYTIFITADESIRILRCSNDIDGNVDVQITDTPYTFTLSQDTTIYVSWRNADTTDSFTNMQVMLNTGSTAKPYEPWGYKIPISTLQGSAYIYLNEQLYKVGDTADTINADGTITRRIGKVVLDGTENQWILYEVPAAPPTLPYALYQFYTNNSLSLGGVQNSSCYSNIAPYGFNSRTRQDGDLGVFLVTSGNEVAFQMEAAKSSFPDVTAWTTYLSQNPVTVYYIKAAPTTEQITLPSIPTTEGANSITVDTRVQPSEFTATWTGWHNAYVKEKSENIYNKYSVLEVANLGTRYGQYVPEGIYSIYNDTDNTVYWGIQDMQSRFKACEPHSTATVDMSVQHGSPNYGFMMPYNDASLGDVSIVQGSTVPDHYIPYWK